MPNYIDVFVACAEARRDGVLIKKVSQTDKEYHFQNWVQNRLEGAKINFDDPGRNTYPDFRLVDEPIGFEVKGLRTPGREADYDSNSQIPQGKHNNREIYYIFGRYPAEIDKDEEEYPLIDLVVCHGDFLNATSDYVHKNKSVKGFGSFGDINIRDRKMYVVPTPMKLLDGVVGTSTLILPENYQVDGRIQRVGSFSRTEVDKLIRSYTFDLQTNDMITTMIDNPNGGKTHNFSAYRLSSDAPKAVTLR